MKKISLLLLSAIFLLSIEGAFAAKKNRKVASSRKETVQVQEFRKMAKYFTQKFILSGSVIAGDIAPEQLEYVVSKMKVQSYAGASLEDQAEYADLRMQPELLTIDFSAKAWDERSVEEKYQFVIHALLGALNVEDEMLNQANLKSRYLAEVTFPEGNRFSLDEMGSCGELNARLETLERYLSRTCAKRKGEDPICDKAQGEVDKLKEKKSKDCKAE